jgi:IstB-like ATP binding protein.
MSGIILHPRGRRERRELSILTALGAELSCHNHRDWPFSSGVDVRAGRYQRVLFPVVNDRHLKKQPMIFTTSKPVSEWGKVLHDEDMAAASSIRSSSTVALSTSMDPRGEKVIS